RHALLAESSSKLVQVEPAPGPEHDARAGDLAETLVGQPDDGCARDLRLLQEQLLDLRWGDVHPPADDDVLDAPDDRQVAFLVEHTEVARTDPPALVGDHGRRAVLLEDAEGDAGTAHEHLTRRADHVSTRLVTNGDLHTDQ